MRTQKTVRIPVPEDRGGSAHAPSPTDGHAGDGNIRPRSTSNNLIHMARAAVSVVTAQATRLVREPWRRRRACTHQTVCLMVAFTIGWHTCARAANRGA